MTGSKKPTSVHMGSDPTARDMWNSNCDHGSQTSTNPEQACPLAVADATHVHRLAD
jgi:hypothetical protein